MDSHRAGWLGCCTFLLCGLLGFAGATNNISISSPTFAQGEAIPAKYAYKGQNISPELRIENVPKNARSLVLIVDDPDSPSGLWTHWVVWNIPAATKMVAEGKLPPGAQQGKNSFGNFRYDGPVPPSGTHRYIFHIYALDLFLKIPSGSDRNALKGILAGPDHVLGTGETFGTYSASP